MEGKMNGNCRSTGQLNTSAIPSKSLIGLSINNHRHSIFQSRFARNVSTAQYTHSVCQLRNTCSLPRPLTWSFTRSRLVLLRSSDVPEDHIEWIKRIYQGKSHVRRTTGVKREFFIMIGLHQGSVWPVAFRHSDGCYIRPHRKCSTWSVLYADDILNTEPARYKLEGDDDDRRWTFDRRNMAWIWMSRRPNTWNWAPKKTVQWTLMNRHEQWRVLELHLKWNRTSKECHRAKQQA